VKGSETLLTMMNDRFMTPYNICLVSPLFSFGPCNVCNLCMALNGVLCADLPLRPIHPRAN